MYRSLMRVLDSQLRENGARIPSLRDLGRTIVGDSCDLKVANGIHDASCDGSDCVFWRALSHLGENEGEGCAIRHYELLGDSSTTAWLLSVKERLEAKTPGAA